MTPRRVRSPGAVNGPAPPRPGERRGQRRTWVLGSAKDSPLLAARAGRGSAGPRQGTGLREAKRGLSGSPPRRRCPAAAPPVLPARRRPRAGPAPPGWCVPAARGRCALVRPPVPRLPAPSAVSRSAPLRKLPRPRPRLRWPLSSSMAHRPGGASGNAAPLLSARVSCSAACAPGHQEAPPPCAQFTARFHTGSPPPGRNRIATFRSNLGAEDQRGLEPLGW